MNLIEEKKNYIFMKIFLILMIVLSSNDLISFNYGFNIKPGFFVVLFFAFFSIFRVVCHNEYKRFFYLGDVFLIFWLFLCVVFCFVNGGGRNYVYTFSAIIYVGMVLSARSVIFLNNKYLIISAYVAAGIIISLLGIFQFIFSLLGWGDFIFVKQWWYEGIIARVNGLSYEPSYYGLVMTPFFVFSSFIRGTRFSYKVGNNTNILFFLSGVAIVISSSRISLIFNILFFVFVGIYKFIVFDRKTFVKDMVGFCFFVIFSVVFFVFISFSVDFLVKQKNIVDNSPHNEIVAEYVDSNKEKLSDDLFQKEKNKYVQNEDSGVEEDNKVVEEQLVKGNSGKENLPITGNSDLNSTKKVKDESTSMPAPMHQGILSGTGLDGEAGHSVSVRLDDMKKTLEVARNHLIEGVGLGGVAYEIAKNEGARDVGISDVRKYEGLVPIIEIAAATGVIGLFSFILWGGYAIIPNVFFRPISKSSCCDEYIMVSLCVSVLFQFILLQFNQNILRMYFWINIFIMMIFVYSHYNRNAK